MNINKLPSFLPYTAETLPPAQLWIGKHDHLTALVQECIQKLLCKHGGCQTCTTCMRIRDKQHHSLLWLHPEKNYTIEQFDDLFSKISFCLDKDELFFFIIQKADFLTTACGNKLLKSMEEPPQGYHFILLAERTEQILPTIRSRCTLHTFNSELSTYAEHPLYEHLTTKIATPIEWAKMVDTAAIGERESIELLDTIFRYWLECYKKNNSLEKKESIEKIIYAIELAAKKPPMPGSSVTFWRNFYLHINEYLRCISS